MTTEQIRIRLTDEETKELRQLADRCDLQVTALAGVFVRAAMRAVEAEGGRFQMPLKFQIVEQTEPSYRVNEPKGRK